MCLWGGGSRDDTGQNNTFGGLEGAATAGLGADVTEEGDSLLRAQRENCFQSLHISFNFSSSLLYLKLLPSQSPQTCTEYYVLIFHP